MAASLARTGAAAEIDYGRPEAWLARPGLASAATLTPKDSGYSNLEATARADVFYVHPTTGMREGVANVPIDDPQALATGRVMLMAQSTPFNGIARIYAPRYRQIAMHVYDEGEAALQAPMNFAYEDVRQAFAHYAAHDNQGRPFFLVAHSQGSNHALRLLQEEIQGGPLEARLVAAYLPGGPTPLSIFADHLTRVPPCATAEQIGCAAIWGVFGEGYRDFRGWEAINVYWDASTRRWRSAAGARLVNINPVSWRDDDVPAPAGQHRGAVPFGVPATHFSRPLEHLVSARTEHGYTLVSPAPLPSGLFDDGGTFGGANYHVFDINLFWADLRANARLRLASFLRQRDRAAYPIIEGPMTATAIAGEPFQLRFSVHNAAARWHVEGLPEGLHLDPDTAEISGVPVTPGPHAVIVTATNDAGADTAELALIVTPASK
ncbi:MAG: DUF3089 domain-containing protein [Hyphomicrobiaceae bacterium]|nr:DUF3089 domain-containing protein [Hyphomicrobiaceae bacterium]